MEVRAGLVTGVAVRAVHIDDSDEAHGCGCYLTEAAVGVTAVVFAGAVAVPVGSCWVGC